MSIGTRLGTSCFRTFEDACKYYAPYGLEPEDVGLKLDEGEISVGAPQTEPGCEVQLDDKEGRYFLLVPEQVLA